MLNKYKNEEGIVVTRNQQNCPTEKSKSEEDLYFCCVYGEEYSYHDVYTIEVRGKIKNICKECANTIYVII